MKRSRIVRWFSLPFLRQWFYAMRLIRRRKLSLAGAIVVAIFLLLSLLEGALQYLGLVLRQPSLGWAILPYSPYARGSPHIPPSIFNTPPNFSHIFGTDQLGHDVFAQMIFALPLDAEVALMVIISAIAIGVTLGIIAGYIGGRTNQLIMRVTDIFIAFPGIILALAIAASLGPGLIHAMEALIVVWWPTYTRLARGEVLAVKNQLYIEAARAAGLSSWKIMLKHVTPNIISPIIIYGTLDIGNVILQTSILSYLGFGAQPPTPELGRLVFESQGVLLLYPWLSLVPGAIIFFVVLGFNLLGDGLRDVLDPRLQRLIALPSTIEKQEIEKPATVVTELHEEPAIVADGGS